MDIKKIMKTLIQKATSTPVFIAALFTVAKIWEQLKCPSRDEWIKKSQYIYIQQNIISPQKNEINDVIFSNMMELEAIMLSGVS